MEGLRHPKKASVDMSTLPYVHLGAHFTSALGFFGVFFRFTVVLIFYFDLSELSVMANQSPTRDVITYCAQSFQFPCMPVTYLSHSV